MFSLFMLLFKASYWRMLFRGATWSEAWISLKRAHKDRRARKHLRQVLMLALIPALCGIYLLLLAGTGAWMVLLLLMPILWWRYRAREEKRPRQNVYAVERAGLRELTDDERGEFRKYFADVALLYAVMLDRAGSENFLRTKILPDGMEVTTRRVHIDLLKQKGIWDKMALDDRLALMVPDGEWPEDWNDTITMGFEPLRLMRWILRIDFHLPVVGRQLRFEYGLAHELVQEPGRIFDGNELVTVASIMNARVAAEQFYYRCVAEQIYRGDAEPADEQSRQRAADIATALHAKQHDDLVLGTKLVSEVSSEELNWATKLSRRRLVFLHWTVLVMQRGKPPDAPYSFKP